MGVEDGAPTTGLTVSTTERSSLFFWPQMACDERPGFTSQQLEVALGPGTPTNLTGEVEAAFDFVAGSVEWATIADDVAIDRSPLDLDVPVYVVADLRTGLSLFCPAGPPSPSPPKTTGVNCSLLPGYEEIFVTWSSPTEGVRILVDGENIYEVPAPEVDQVDQVHKALAEATLDRFGIYRGADNETTGPSPSAPTDNEVADGGFSNFAAATTPQAYQLSLSGGDGTWSEPVDCGSAALLATPPMSCSVSLLSDRPSLAISGFSMLTIVRNGEPLDVAPVVDGFVDHSAPEGPTRYQVRATGTRDRDDVTIECGEVDVPPRNPASDLTAAGLAARSSHGAYAYLTLVRLCPGCDSAPISLNLNALGSTPGESRVVFAFTPEQVGLAGAPSVVAPSDVPELLIAALGAGKVVTYDIDPNSGLVYRWSIDGVGGEFLCYEFDTAPPELRRGPCNPDFDRLGAPGR